MLFWVYENWRARGHRVVIHLGTCAFCNDGSGLNGGHDPRNARWHGAFRSFEDAYAFARSLLGGGEPVCCEKCAPEACGAHDSQAVR